MARPNNEAPDSIKEVLPKESFVKIEKTIKLEFCNVDSKKLTKCKTRSIASSASGFVIKNDKTGSYIVTAAHVCDDSELRTFLEKSENVEVANKKFEIIDVDKIRYNFITLAYNKEIDVCTGYSYNMTKPPIKVAASAPSDGDIIYNLAAPLGLFDKDVIPIMHGHFVGITDNVALYSVPATGGSSGSPLLNSKGELVGLIHSVYAKFLFLTISPTHEQLVNFINTNTDKTAFMVQNLIEIFRQLNNLIN